jgi:hypothetical protein
LWQGDVSNATDALLRRNMKMPMTHWAVIDRKEKRGTRKRSARRLAALGSGFVKVSLTIS